MDRLDILQERIARLEKRVDELEARDKEHALLQRRGLLGQVNALERRYGFPSTAEAAQWYKNQKNREGCNEQE